MFAAQELAEDMAKDEAVKRVVDSAKLDWRDTAVFSKTGGVLQLQTAPFSFRHYLLFLNLIFC